MIVRAPAAAEDVTQEVFIRAYRYLDRYDASRPLYAWLAAIAVRLSRNWLIRQGRTSAREGTSLDAVTAAAAADESALATLLADEHRRHLWKTVAALPRSERAAVVLHYVDGLAVRDTARALGVTDGTIKTLLFRARRRLRDRMAPERTEREARS